MTTSKKPTLAGIRSHNMAAGFHVFDHKTLRFFGETMRNYRVGPKAEGGWYVYRTGGKAGNATFVYNETTGQVRKGVA